MKLIPKLSESDLKRFWSKVDKSGECWLWTANHNQSQRSQKLRYGFFKIGGRTGKNYLAHRVSYAIAKGEPGQKEVCHSCDTPLCVNPNHLWIGVSIDNIEDRTIKNRSFSKLTIEQVHEIFVSHESQYALASQYGVSQVSISDIKTGRTWSRITGLPKLHRKREQA